MNKEVVLSILRSVMTALGSYLVGKNFLGAEIDDVLWQGILGAVMTTVSIIWGIVTKELSIEGLQSGLRSVIMFIGALLVGSGILKEEVVASILAIIATIIPVIYSQVSKQKSKNIANGEIGIADLRGVDVTETAITPSVTTPPKQ